MLPPAPVLHAVPGVAFSEMPHFMCKAEYSKSGSLWFLWSMHHFLASLSDNVPKWIFLLASMDWPISLAELILTAEWQDSHMWAGALHVSQIPRWHGTSLLQQDAWFYGADSSAAHSSPSQSSCRKLDAGEQTSTFFSQEVVSCLYKHGAWHVHQKCTQISFQQGCKPSLPHLQSMCLDGKVMPHSTSRSSLRCSRVAPLILILSSKGVKPRVLCVSAG